MDEKRISKLISRREMLQATTAIAGGSLFASWLPETMLARPAAWPLAQQSGAAPANQADAMRARMAATPLETQKLSEDLTLLSGPGGNVVVLTGPDGKIMVDTFVRPAWDKLKDTLDGLGSAPLKTVIDTHWHFDHTDNNASLHSLGAAILAHENTKKRMSESHDLAVLGMHFDPSPAAALPTQTFRQTQRLEANGETLALEHIAPAHTDTDIYVHYQKANVLHMGDVFFNGMYPYIDGGTGGSIGGMIAACTKVLATLDAKTRIVPGHGPVADKAALVKFRDMMVTARDHLQKFKSAGKTVEEAVAAKPLTDLEPAWGKGFFTGDAFVQIAYGTL